LRLTQAGWNALAIGGGAVAAVFWYVYSTVRADIEGGADWKTPLLLVLLPVGIALLRRPIDWALRPIQKVRRYIPRLLILGMGIAAPYGIAAWMYDNRLAENLFNAQMREFPYARRALVVGTIISYLILRTPRGSRAGSRLAAPAAAVNAALQLVAFAIVSSAATAWADHYLQDIWNLNDGLRTPGWAPVLAGTGTVIISILINGGEVIQTALNPRGDPDDRPDEEPTRYSMEINTEEKRMSLAADGEDRLWIYAKITCNKPEVPAAQLTAGLGFSFSGKYTGWMAVKSSGFTSGFKAVQIAATPPTPESEIDEGATVTVNIRGATADGDPIEAPLELKLEEEPGLKVTVLD
jgi:hypothetical protein